MAKVSDEDARDIVPEEMYGGRWRPVRPEDLIDDESIDVGTPVGICPAPSPNGGLCATPLFIPRGSDATTCAGCGKTWGGARGGWLRLHALQAKVAAAGGDG